MKISFTPSERLLFACAKIKPTQEELQNIDNLLGEIENWDETADLLWKKAAGALLYKKIPFLKNKHLIPDAAFQKFKQAYLHNFKRSYALREAFVDVAKKMDENGIKIVALKGIFISEWLYGDIGLRQMSDIDFLVAVNDADKCLEILGEMGYKSICENKRREFNHFPPMIKNGISIDVHIKLHRKNAPYNLKPVSLLNNAEIHVENVNKIWAPNLYDLLISVCIHADRHFRSVQFIQFTCFYDIVNVLKYKDINYEMLIRKCREYNCETDVFKMILLCEKFFKPILPAEIHKRYENLLTKKDEIRFIDYLHGISQPIDFKKIRQLKTLKLKIRYIVKIILFPEKNFMIERYEIKTPSLFWLYYPYRHWLTIKKVIK